MITEWSGGFYRHIYDQWWYNWWFYQVLVMAVVADALVLEHEAIFTYSINIAHTFSEKYDIQCTSIHKLYTPHLRPVVIFLKLFGANQHCLNWCPGTNTPYHQPSAHQPSTQWTQLVFHRWLLICTYFRIDMQIKRYDWVNKVLIMLSILW